MNINGIFNPENRFFTFMDKILNLCLLGILWGLFSLPVITIGASTTALFQYTLRLIRNEEGYVWRSFSRGFFKNFFPATVLWLGAAAVGAFLALDVYCCQFLPFSGAVKWAARVALISLLIVYLLTIIYLFPLTAFFRFSLKKTVANAFVMAMGNLHVSITVLVIYAVCAGASLVFPELFMIWFALASYAASHCFRYVMEKYMEADVKIADAGAKET
ncbi:MAG: DUF624 domain-containing protein [Eubacteriales bacterium]|nr:DUF624 domain-containing protein [Eubacteriales bacterium]